MTTLSEIRDKFEKAGMGTMLDEDPVFSRLTVWGKEEEELIYVDDVDGRPHIEVHILHKALFNTPSELQSALDVVYGPEVFKIESYRLYFHEARIPLHHGDDICVVLPYPMDKVWTTNGKKDQPKVKDQPQAEAAMTPKLCECCEEPDEPTVQCTECPAEVCLDCMDHDHHINYMGIDQLKLSKADHIFDRKGNPITFHRWGKLNDRPEYKRVAEVTIGNRYWVSTVWLGLNHQFRDGGPPIIFETMVFPKGSWGEMDCERYETLEGAKRGHERMVKKWWRRRRGLKERGQGLPGRAR